jgi:CheY-like chemotaxis protein
MNSKKILVVDDNDLILKMLSVKLKANGYEVVKALDGSTAVSSVRNDPPDLILLDMYFPPDVAHGGGVPWDGFLIINWLKRMDEAVGIPFIVISGGDEENLKPRALAAGASAYFRKPIDQEGLVRTIRRTLGELEDDPVF